MAIFVACDNITPCFFVLTHAQHVFLKKVTLNNKQNALKVPVPISQFLVISYSVIFIF